MGGWNKGNSKHSQATIESVIGYFKKGWPLSDIACRMDLTKRSVSGILHRNLLRGQVKRKSRKGPEASAATAKVADEAKAPPPAPRKMNLPEPVNLALGMMDLTQMTCRFPHGDSPFVFCGQQTDGDHPYCPYHEEFTHQAGSAISNRSDAAQKQHSDRLASTS
ncbi:MAG TPA: GcrA family cell cycle regulator [Acidisoma sp.]|nr:GcrA family cell cycle regulator [Acidisoma sp.]